MNRSTKFSRLHRKAPDRSKSERLCKNTPSASRLDANSADGQRPHGTNRCGTPRSLSTTRHMTHISFKKKRQLFPGFRGRSLVSVSSPTRCASCALPSLQCWNINQLPCRDQRWTLQAGHTQKGGRPPACNRRSQLAKKGRRRQGFRS